MLTNCLELMTQKHEQGVHRLEQDTIVKYIVMQGLYSPLQVRYPISIKTWPLHKYVDNPNLEAHVDQLFERLHGRWHFLSVTQNISLMHSLRRMAASGDLW